MSGAIKFLLCRFKWADDGRGGSSVCWLGCIEVEQLFQGPLWKSKLGYMVENS